MVMMMAMLMMMMVMMMAGILLSHIIPHNGILQMATDAIVTRETGSLFIFMIPPGLQVGQRRDVRDNNDAIMTMMGGRNLSRMRWQQRMSLS